MTLSRFEATVCQRQPWMMEAARELNMRPRIRRKKKERSYIHAVEVPDYSNQQPGCRQQPGLNIKKGC
jgi:hypothetical protein